VEERYRLLRDPVEVADEAAGPPRFIMRPRVEDEALLTRVGELEQEVATCAADRDRLAADVLRVVQENFRLKSERDRLAHALRLATPNESDKP
jgi:putative hemolysin